MIERTSDADKTQLMRWMFAAVTKDPALAPMTNITQSERDKINKGTAELYGRLILVDCRTQTVAAIKNEGAEALGASGNALGQAAAHKLMSSPEGQQELSKFSDYFDKKGWEALGKEAGVKVDEK